MLIGSFFECMGVLFFYLKGSICDICVGQNSVSASELEQGFHNNSKNTWSGFYIVICRSMLCRILR